MADSVTEQSVTDVVTKYIEQTRNELKDIDKHLVRLKKDKRNVMYRLMTQNRALNLLQGKHMINVPKKKEEPKQQ